MAPISLPELNTPVRDVARPDPVRLLEGETVAEALARLRGEAIGERIVYFYVTNAAGRLAGVVPTRRLLLSDPAAAIGEIMVRPVVSVGETEPLGHALEAITARRLLALPVVDAEGRLVGVLDVSILTRTMVDLERRESVDEIFQMVGLHVGEERTRTLGWALRNRFPWLLMNIGSGILAALIADLFEGALQAVVAVAFFIPLVLTLAESAAMQTVTMSLQTIQVTKRRGGDQAGRMFGELRVGLLLGGISGAIVAALGLAWLGLPRLIATVGCAILVATGAGAAFGYVVPRAVHRLRLDPKIASGPAVLALTDVAAIFLYLGLAALVLG
ncbi:MAG: magnesium transporter [Acidobacteria bacterium]|nr:magnesium transporter [Acidobacteriota bacterium]